MSGSTRFFTLLTACFVALCAHAAEPAKKPPRLTNTAAFSSEYRDAVVAVARYVGSPQDFYAEIEPKNGGRELWFHLWHKSAFTPENIGVVGNPGGKCRDVVYDSTKHKVVQTWWWQ